MQRVIRKYPFKYSVDGGRYVEVVAKNMNHVKTIAKIRNPRAREIKVKKVVGKANNYNTHNHAYLD